MNVKDIIKNPKSENTVNTLKALVAGIPMVGGPFNSLMNDYLPNYKFERLKNFTEDLSEKFENFKGEIDNIYLNSKEFGYLFEETLKRVNVEYQEEKLNAYKNFLFNASTDTSTENSKKEYILLLIEKLHYYHLIILKIFYFPEEIIKDFSLNLNSINNGFLGNLGAVFRFLIKPYNIDSYLWENGMKEIEQMGLIKETHSNLGATISTANITTLKERQTSLGVDLYNFIKDY